MVDKKLLSIIFSLTCLLAFADMGSISFEPDIKIFEPNQRALIAWNGEEEILILSTDLKASAPTKVLEVIPLPSEPKVTEGNVKIFEKAVDLINAKRYQRAKKNMTLGGEDDDMLSEGDEGEEPPAAEITFHEKIGAHDISTIKLLNETGFIKWVEDYLKTQGVENPKIPDPLKKVIGEYIKDGYVWFVFDVVELTKKQKTKQAIQFRFKSDLLYYPLRITKTETGNTSCEFLILTRKLLSRNMFQGEKGLRKTHKPVVLRASELIGLNPEIFTLLGKPPFCQLRIWELKGKLSEFKQDLLVGYSGVVLSCFKHYPSAVGSMIMHAKDTEDRYLCMLNSVGGVHLYDDKTNKIKFLSDVGRIDRLRFSHIDFHKGEFRLIFKNGLYYSVSTDGKVIK